MFILITLHIIYKPCAEYKTHAASGYVYNHIFVTVEQRQAINYFLLQVTSVLCNIFNVKRDIFLC